MKNPLVSVIIVSYNTSSVTQKCLKAVYASQGIPQDDLEVIVVDNHSTDNTVASIKSSFSKVVVIQNEENHGFGGGNNQGVNIAKGKYVLLLNTDAYVEKDTIVTLVSELQSHSGTTAVGPKYVFADHSFQQSAGYFPTPMRVIGWMLGLDKLPLIKSLFPSPYHLYDPSWYKVARPVDWLMGACVLMSRQDYQSVGGFDEKIFMYTEEVDLFYRLYQANKQSNFYTPATSIVHLGSVSSKSSSTSRLVHELTGIKHFYQHHFPYYLPLIKLVLLMGVVLRIMVFSLIPARQDDRREYLKYLKS
jgi:GT2 family glycosyltransferase